MKKKGGKKEVTAAELEEKFDNGESILEYCDLSTAKVVKPSLRRITFDMPDWRVGELDAAAQHRGVTRQELIRCWLVDRLDHEARGKNC